MSTDTRWYDQIQGLSPDRPARYGLLAGIFALGVLTALGYHISEWLYDTPPGTIGMAFYHVMVLIGFVAFWQIVSQRFRKGTHSPTANLLSILLAGVLFTIVGYLLDAIRPAGQLAMDIALYSFPSILHIHAVVLLEAAFFFFLLARLRQLVLYKRSRKSERNWNIMLGLMALASLSAIDLDVGQGLGPIQFMLIVPAVGAMLLCAFRLSWIIFLSFRKKLIGIALSFGLVLLLAIGSGAGSTSFIPNAEGYIMFYSYPLRVFFMLTAIFGVLYGSTAMLFLLFHLPTTSDFQRKADQTAAMQRLTHLVNQAFEREKLSQSIVEAPINARIAQRAWLMLSPPEDESTINATAKIDVSTIRQNVDLKAIWADVAKNETATYIPEASTDDRLEAGDDRMLESLLAVPLTSQDNLRGVLFCARDVAHGFESDDIDAITGLAAQAALALDHAYLFQEHLEKERLERELSIAREIQQRLLPDHLPEVAGLSLMASSKAAQEVGGDYYDVICHDDDRVSFIVADVSGKGTSAAFYMAEMQGIFRSAAPLSPNPTAFLSRANSALNGTLDKSAFVSVMYGLLDPEMEELQLARAGHCPAAIIDLHGRARYLRPGGMAVGMTNTPHFTRTLEEERIKLQPGDVLVLFTDGFIEGRNRDGKEFGYDRLLDALRENRHEDADGLHNALHDELDNFTEGRALDDDTTLLVLKWHGIRKQPQSQTAQPDVEVATADAKSTS